MYESVGARKSISFLHYFRSNLNRNGCRVETTLSPRRNERKNGKNKEKCFSLNKRSVYIFNKSACIPHSRRRAVFRECLLNGDGATTYKVCRVEIGKKSTKSRMLDARVVVCVYAWPFIDR